MNSYWIIINRGLPGHGLQTRHDRVERKSTSWLLLSRGERAPHSLGYCENASYPLLPTKG